MAFHRLRLAALIVPGALLASALPAAAQTAEAGIRAWVASIDASPDWTASFQALNTDSSGRVTTISGLTIGPEARAEFKVVFDPIRVTAYGEPSGGGFTAEDISGAGARLEGPALTVNFGQIKISGIQVPNLAGIRFDKDRMFTSMVRAYAVLARARVNQASIDKIDFRQTVNGMTSTFSYGSVTMTRMEGGRIDSFVAGPMTLDAPSPEGLVKMTIERVESLRTDLGALLKVYDADQYANGVGDGEWRQVVGFAGYRNLTIEAPSARMTLASVSAEDVKVRQPPRPFTAFFDAIFANPNMSKEENKRLASEHVLNLLWSMGVGRAAIDGFDMSGTGIDRLRVGQFYMRNLSADGFGEVAMSDFKAAKTGEGSFDIARFVYGDIVFPKLAAIRAAMEASDRGVDFDPLPLIPKLGFLELNGLAIDMIGQAKVALDRFRLDLGGYVGPIPTAIDVDMKGLTTDVASLPDAEGRKILTELGYQKLTAEFGLGIRWNEAAESLSLTDYRMGVKEMGRITMDVQLSGLRRSALERPQEIDRAIQSLLFVGVRIQVDDESITNRSIRMQAKRSNLTEEQFRQQVAGAMPFFLMMLRNPDFQTRLAPTLQAFIMSPGRLVLSAKPVNPVPFLTLLNTAQRSPERLPNLLAIDVAKSQ